MIDQKSTLSVSVHSCSFQAFYIQYNIYKTKSQS